MKRSYLCIGEAYAKPRITREDLREWCSDPLKERYGQSDTDPLLWRVREKGSKVRAKIDFMMGETFDDLAAVERLLVPFVPHIQEGQQITVFSEMHLYRFSNGTLQRTLAVLGPAAKWETVTLNGSHK